MSTHGGEVEANLAEDAAARIADGLFFGESGHLSTFLGMNQGGGYRVFIIQPALGEIYSRMYRPRAIDACSYMQ